MMTKFLRKITTGLGLCLLLLFTVFGFALSKEPLFASASGSFSLEKTSFREGEDVYVTAVGSGTDWVGLFREGETTSIVWYYVAENPTVFNVFDGEFNAGETKESVTAGRYVIAFVPDDKEGLANATQTQIITVETSALRINKTTFVEGEPITVTASGSGTDWVGIYRKGETYSARWYYVSSAGTADITAFGNHNEALGISSTISAGEYTVYLVRNDGAYTNAEESVSITVMPSVCLSVPKTEFLLKEPIYVTATHTSEDAWVGLYRITESEYCRWYYVSSANGVPYDITKGEKNIETSFSPNVTRGDYVLRLMVNGEAVQSLEISVVGDPTIPSAPLSATYALENDTDGFATGRVSVKMPTDDMKERCIALFWGDEEGVFEDYTYIKFKVTGETTDFTFGKHVTIPYGATRLYVYAKNTNGDALSNECVTVDLPKNAACKNPLNTYTGSSFWVISDTHIDQDNNHVHNQHFQNLLGDIARIDGGAMSLIINGDMTNRGRDGDFSSFQTLCDNATGVPPIVLSMGNHEYYSGTYEYITNKFYELAKYPDGSLVNKMNFDYWQGGYHFVFLGTDATPQNLTHAVLTEETLQWFEETLDESKDTGKPTFVFLHQPMYDTVAGSRPGEDYSGVEAQTEARLRGILAKHPEVMMFNGHTHWTMNSTANIREGTTDLPGTIFNTSSAGYLWTTYDNESGDYLYGSEGYYARVYGGTLYVLGYDFVADKWISAAQYCVKLADCNSCADNDKNHVCDVCGANVGKHEGVENSHICEYCKQQISSCIDADTDHCCDICKRTMGVHQGTETSHICAYCKQSANDCFDSNGDNVCDVCGEKTGENAPEEPDKPVVPDIPDIPTTPDIPSTPDIPDEPELPEDSGDTNQDNDINAPEQSQPDEQSNGCNGTAGGTVCIIFVAGIVCVKMQKRKRD